MSRTRYKPAISLLLALAVASVFTLSSFAASKGPKPAGKAADEQKETNSPGLPVGRLIGMGQIAIDGNEAQSGVTVLSGSTVATGSDGNATILLGSLGRIELQPDSTVSLTLSANMVQMSIGHVGRVVQSLPTGVLGQVTVQGERARLAVTFGSVEVKSARSQHTLHAGEETAFDQAAEAVASGDAVFAVDGGVTGASATQPSLRGRYTSAGKLGIIVMVGLAAGITGGVLSGSNNGSSRQTALRPSRVLP